MRRTDRLLGILFQLNDQEVVPAAELAEQFEVSVRTIYRDMDALSELGIPFYSQTGRNGGFQLLEGYRLPPIMFSEREAISLVLGIALLRSLQARPYAADLDLAAGKLIQALPSVLQQTLHHAQQRIGFETTAHTAFHIECGDFGSSRTSSQQVNRVLDEFLDAILSSNRVDIHYQSPYRRGSPRHYDARPVGLFWDRDCWYLIGKLKNAEERIWRADRVQKILQKQDEITVSDAGDIRAYLNRSWLAAAMRDWASEYPVRILLTPAQADRLRADWYYQHAMYEDAADGRIMLTFGQDRPEIVCELVRWLGPGAELIEPEPWRALLRRDLEAMLGLYQDTPRL